MPSWVFRCVRLTMPKWRPYKTTFSPGKSTKGELTTYWVVLRLSVVGHKKTVYFAEAGAGVGSSLLFPVLHAFSQATEERVYSTPLRSLIVFVIQAESTRPSGLSWKSARGCQSVPARGFLLRSSINQTTRVRHHDSKAPDGSRSLPARPPACLHQRFPLPVCGKHFSGNLGNIEDNTLTLIVHTADRCGEVDKRDVGGCDI